MVNKILDKGRSIFISPQSSILSAATTIMIMVVASRTLGLVRQRVLAHFFTPNELSLYFAAFRLPDLIFEVLVFGTFASAFIPVFAKELKKSEADAWKLASYVVNIGIILFTILAIILALASGWLYGVSAPGFSPSERSQIADFAKILFVAQGFFVVSYVLTGVLESMRRFLVPALAPLFYNLGIIFGTLLLSERMGLLGPTIGVIGGAFLHFSIQLPLARKLGFRFLPELKVNDDVKKIGKLALPRIIEVSVLQVSKFAELFFASIISTASYTFYTFGNTLQLLPVGLFGTSIAKAALPTLSSISEDKEKFEKTVMKSLGEMFFLIMPIATILIVLRIPVIRLVYGTDLFSWEATVQTSYVLSAFGVGIVFQSAVALLARAFYAIHDTKTPVVISISSIVLVVVMDFIIIKILGLDVWGLALAFSIGVFLQTISLYLLLLKKLEKIFKLSSLIPFLKFFVSSVVSGIVMFVLIKFFDRSVWIKRLSFLGQIEATRVLPFERFVLDTRYTMNLLFLTVSVSIIGLFVYITISYLLKTKELWTFARLVNEMVVKKLFGVIPVKEKEPITPTTTESS